MSVRYRDGIEVELSDGTRVVCDAEYPDGDVNVVSHAHADHTPEDPATVVASPLTVALVAARQDRSLDSEDDARVDLLPAGHVAGSRAALITDPDGTRYLYTGDVCTRSRFYLDGFDPPDADVLVVEATYGQPDYVFPPHEQVEAAISEWLDETREEPVICFGYALGRAQKLQRIAAQADRQVYTTPAVRRVNETIERHRDVTFDVDPFEGADLTEGDVLVLPMTSGRIDWVDDLAAEAGATKAGFSGWAVDSSFKFRGDFDVTFPLSDHCDFAELCGLVEAVDPETVYTQHGADDALVSQLTDRGYDATTLKPNQASLSDF